MKQIMIALVLFSASFATCSLHLDDPQFQNTLDTAMNLVFIAVMFSVVVTALAYMFGKGMNSARLNVFAKDSLTQLIITVVLIVFIFSILEGTCQFTTLFLDTPTDPLTDAITYTSQLKNIGQATLRTLYKASIDEKFRGARMIGYYGPFVGGETKFPGAYHNAFSRQYEILIDMVTIGYVSAGIQYFILQSIQGFVFPVLIPFGLLLRALPFLREAGNIVLAIAFTLLVILPFAYAINSSAIDVSKPCDVAVDERALGGCSGMTGWGGTASYLFQTIFLPNLAIVVTITGAGAMMKAIKVLP